MKIAINREIGGFSLNQEHVNYLIKKGWALTEYGEEEKSKAKRYRTEPSFYPGVDITCSSLSEKDHLELPWDKKEVRIRTHSDIIEAIENCTSSRHCAVVEIPDNVEVFIAESECGVESIHEIHRVWY